MRLRLTSLSFVCASSSFTSFCLSCCKNLTLELITSLRRHVFRTFNEGNWSEVRIYAICRQAYDIHTLSVQCEWCWTAGYKEVRCRYIKEVQKAYLSCFPTLIPSAPAQMPRHWIDPHRFNIFEESHRCYAFTWGVYSKCLPSQIHLNPYYWVHVRELFENRVKSG